MPHLHRFDALLDHFDSVPNDSLLDKSPTISSAMRQNFKRVNQVGLFYLKRDNITHQSNRQIRAEVVDVKQANQGQKEIQWKHQSIMAIS